MHAIEPARLKPDVTIRSLPADSPAVETDDARTSPAPLITGRALVFWDPMTLPGTKFAKKLDAIDTDQITPAADCVSESLETLDERWKAGSFRYMMPDFRARVHRGENFVIAGDRFAIGSSREMSPAGLKGVAEEAGLQMVIVCGQNMGDIFRRNSFNLGLHVVQSPEAVADARDGDEFTFDPLSRKLRNVTQAKAYDPVPLSPKEEEIRRSGGIFAVGRREFRKSVLTRPVVDWPEPHAAAKMTTTEQIVWAHRVDKDLRPADLTPGATLRVYADLLPASDGTAPTIFLCSPASTPTTNRRASVANSRACTTSPSPTMRPLATAFSISTFRNRAWSCPDSSFPVPTRTVVPMGRTEQSESASVRRRSGSDGRPATSTSRWPGSAASCFAAGCSPGSAARTSCWNCFGNGALDNHKACP